MDVVLQEFLRLCDVAIVEAEKLRQSQRDSTPKGLMIAAERTLQNLRGLKESAAAGRLPRPSNGAGLFLVRGIGEWADGTTLMDAAEVLEDFYRAQM